MSLYCHLSLGYNGMASSFCVTALVICWDTVSLTLTYCRTEERAAGWYRLTREILKLPEAPSVSKEASKDKSQKAKRPQPLIKLVMRR